MTTPKPPTRITTPKPALLRVRSAAIVRPDGRKLRQLREEANLSRRELSRLAGLAESTVRKAEHPRPWEHSEIGTLQMLAEVLEVDWQELVSTDR